MTASVSGSRAASRAQNAFRLTSVRHVFGEWTLLHLFIALRAGAIRSDEVTAATSPK